MRRCVVLLALPLTSGLTEAALGANCRGTTPCRCGDKVTANYSMTPDLGPCPCHGLVVKSNVTVDCQWRRITGTGSGAERHGTELSLDGVPMLSAADSAFASGSVGLVLGSVSTTKVYRADNLAASAR